MKDLYDGEKRNSRDQAAKKFASKGPAPRLDFGLSKGSSKVRETRRGGKANGADTKERSKMRNM